MIETVEVISASILFGALIFIIGDYVHMNYQFMMLRKKGSFTTGRGTYTFTPKPKEVKK